MDMIRVALVDDQAIVRSGVASGGRSRRARRRPGAGGCPPEGLVSVMAWSFRPPRPATRGG